MVMPVAEACGAARQVTTPCCALPRRRTHASLAAAAQVHAPRWAASTQASRGLAASVSDAGTDATATASTSSPSSSSDQQQQATSKEERVRSLASLLGRLRYNKDLRLSPSVAGTRGPAAELSEQQRQSFEMSLARHRLDMRQAMDGKYARWTAGALLQKRVAERRMRGGQ